MEFRRTGSVRRATALSSSSWPYPYLMPLLTGTQVVATATSATSCGSETWRMRERITMKTVTMGLTGLGSAGVHRDDSWVRGSIKMKYSMISSSA